MQASEPKAISPWMQPFRALRHTNYRWYWISGIGMTGAQGLKQLTLAWLVLDLTGSVGQLGLVIFMQGVPTVLISLMGGVLADRYDRRALLIYTQLVPMVNIVIIAILTIAGQVELWHIYVTSIIFGATQALSMPARQAYIRSLVDKEDIMNAVALNSMLQHASRIVWPSVAGIMITLVGVGPTLIVNGVSYLVGIGALFMIHGTVPVFGQGRSSPLREMADGLRYTWSVPATTLVMGLAISIGLFGLAFMNMAPGFARQELGFNAAETGLFMMVGGLGSLVGSMVLLVINVENKNRLFVGLVFVFAFSLIGLSINPWYWGAFFFSATFGLAATTLSLVANTIVQLVVPSHMLGRVLSLWSLSGGLGSMSALAIGLVGEAFGLRLALGGAASILVVITLWVGVIRSPLRHQDAAQRAAAIAEGDEAPSRTGAE